MEKQKLQKLLHQWNDRETSMTSESIDGDRQRLTDDTGFWQFHKHV